MHQFLQYLKKFLGPNITKQIRPLGHGIKSYLAALYFGFPAKKLKLIGINATKGKTSTTILSGRLLNLFGHKTGYVSTAVINIKGDQNYEFLNPFKMTTIDGFTMQKYLKSMVDSGCEYVVLEMSSQGLEQNRHWGLGKFWITTFMNLYPEHLEAHGSLQNYLEAKGKLFQNLAQNGIFISTDEEIQQEYKNYLFALAKKSSKGTLKTVLIKRNRDFAISESVDKTHQKLNFQQHPINISFSAEFEALNLAFACTILQQINPELLENLAKFENLNISLPGRMEFVETNSASKIDVLVDYAHEPESLKLLLQTLVNWRKVGKYTQVIHILSSDGVGRDDWKKPVMGKLSSELADFTVLTTDNYGQEDNPTQIVDLLGKDIPKTEIGENLSDFGVEVGSHIIKIIKRREAFETALKIAHNILLLDSKAKILICSTGVGTEQGLTQPEGIIKWDEREVWRGLLNK